MKQLLTKSLIALIVPFMVGIFISSCKKSEQGPKTIYQAIASDADYSYLTAAINKANLQSALNGDGKSQLTLFAPDNNAFISAGFKSPSDLLSLPDSTLKQVLLYHVLGTKVESSQIPEANNTPVTTLNGQPVYATRTGDGKVYINGASVIKADIQFSNGVIHRINRVLFPAIGTIVETAIANPDLSYLVAAVLRASEGATDVASVLSGPGPFTVFAPTNQAFINAGFATTADINNADPNTLASILTYHVIAARIFSSDLTDGAMPVTLNGGTVTISLSGGATVKGKGNSTASNIVATDIVATNGVAHIVDQVLLP